MHLFIFAFVLIMLVGCKEEPAVEKVVRGLKTYEIAEIEKITTRRFPAVLEPSELTTLSPEISGTLLPFDLDVGQRVRAGDVIVELDPTSLQLQVENAEAGVEQARVASAKSADTLTRQQALLQTGATTRVNVDNARAEADSAAAAVVQAEKSLATALENLEKATLKAPFDGIINSVEATSFTTVAAGTPIASMYSPESFIVSFSVNFDTVNRLVIGKAATIRLADQPEIALPAVVSQIGSRADAVSSFPIVLELRDGHPLLKAGMAVEAAINFDLPKENGYPAPLSVVIGDGLSPRDEAGAGASKVGVFVFDEATSTVKRRDVTVGGIRGNEIILIDGVEPGDLLASAGVSFLRDGQEVKLLKSGG